jgi:hypothetical protein
MSSQQIHNASSATPPMTPAAPPSFLDRIVEIQATETGSSLGTGILIAPQWVLTAAHLPRQTELARHCTPVWVRHHATGLTKQAVWRRVWENPVDLGMLYLGASADQSIPGDIVPIVDESKLTTETKGWIIGHGVNPGQKALRREFQVLSTHCGGDQEGYKHGCQPNTHVVIHGLADSDVIEPGDSGAPFFVELPDGTTQLAGIVVRQAAGFTYTSYLLHAAFNKLYTNPTVKYRDGVCPRIDVHKKWINETPGQPAMTCPPPTYEWVKLLLQRIRDRFYF